MVEGGESVETELTLPGKGFQWQMDNDVPFKYPGAQSNQMILR